MRGYFGFEVLAIFLKQFLIQRCDKKAGGDAIDLNIMQRPFHREITGEMHQRALAGAVGDAAVGRRVAPHDARDRGDVDNLAAFLFDEFATDHLRTNQRRVDIQIHHLLPPIERHIFGRRHPCAARVVHQHIDATEFFQDRVFHRFDLVGLGDIAGYRQRFHTELFEFGARGLAHFNLPRTQYDVRSRFGQAARHLKTNAGSAAGDDTDLPFEAE